MKCTISYCTNCKKRGVQVKNKLLPRLKKEFPNCIFVDKCLSFCGPGSYKSFVYLNDFLVYANNDADLINKIKEILRRDVYEDK